MAKLADIVTYIDGYLQVAAFTDDSWNGLQVQGKPDVKTIVSAVDAGLETFQQAATKGADLILVHHGLFWKSANPSLVIWRRDRVKTLWQSDMSLYAAHLPLDRHPEVGNNALLLRLLGAEVIGDFGHHHEQPISWHGQLSQPKSLADIEHELQTKIGASCTTLPFGPKEVRTVAVCTGGGSYATFAEALELGVDLYITGDTSELFFLAKDAGCNVIFAGHHATETLGVKALADHLAEKFNVSASFLDLPTGL